MDIYNLISFFGIFMLMAFAWACSADRRMMNWRCIATGAGMQLVLGAVVFRAPGSTAAFLWVNGLAVKVLGAATAGQKFLFGPLAAEPATTTASGEPSVGFILAIQALPIIVFVAALMGLLYYWGIMQVIIRAFARLFTRLMGISGAESLCAASNIFVGIESATTIRPYLARMTRSEFCTILAAGMATVASSTLGLYVLFLGKAFPTIAGHLISASIMSAPAAIVMSKILVPEDGQPLTLGQKVELAYERESSAIESIINGAMAGVKLLVGVCALLIAFLGLIALADLALGQANLSLTMLLGKVMWPFAVVIGVPPGDATAAGAMLGERLIATEVPAYMHLAQAIGDGSLAHPRSPVIIAYALCGFAHVASMAIFVGGIAALVPERRKDVAAVGPRALLAATLACFMTGAVAGTWFHAAETVIRTSG